MCEQGNTVLVRLANSSVEVAVDRCIAPLVRVLNEGGMKTGASCCGHGNRPGSIILEDGRELCLFPSWLVARVLERGHGGPINPVSLDEHAAAAAYRSLVAYAVIHPVGSCDIPVNSPP